MRLIEFMALDAGQKWTRNDVVSAEAMLQRIEKEHTLIKEIDTTSSTSMNYRFANSSGRIGFIASVTQSFCGACDRLRILADGTVRPCLFSDEEWSIRSLMRDGASDDALRMFIKNAVWAKSAGHSMGRNDFVRPTKTMSRIGG